VTLTIATFTAEERAKLIRRARARIRHELRAGSLRYDRRRHLGRLLPVEHYGDLRDEPCETVLACIQFAIRAEREKETKRPHHFDFNRLKGLHQARSGELRRMREAVSFRAAAE
jgi:hypothetical protein